MRKKYLFIVTSIFFLVACSAQATTSESHHENKIDLRKKAEIPAEFLPQDLHVTTLGDSLTEGVGDETDNGGYTLYLKEKFLSQKEFRSVSLLNFGVKGHKTTDLLKRLDKKKVQEGIAKADIIIITIGGNDVMKVVRENFLDLSFEVFENAQNSYEERLKQILSEIREYNPEGEIVLVGLYNPFESLIDISSELNEVIDQWNSGSLKVLSQYENTNFVKIGDIFKDTDENLLSTDEFHPNAKGYELISERIFETLNKE
ncbi:SGNH/GDSL hydrolase family protein [Fredinandcohnia quinoae]|uniref:SGNH/GDSL hydrolase family protein n=1 Tax=Fredinandcohnia quinoae TaxID=2918902 RepID=A0AAW5E8X5_9BACI|nr:SGNH/GDSL hydrolase family protein [Fredinandcohnia sp. SECRCQ15]MCH1626362.1 SGNH/GDSL hydrolase family protein [Fredinandcohnia sp. SECRCQ15]